LVLALTRQERLALGFLTLALVVGTALNWQRRHQLERQGRDPEAEAFVRQFLALNAATQTQQEPNAQQGKGSRKRDAGFLLVDINRASEKELEKLPRIGPAMARRIVEERNRRGGFRRVEDLLEVKGIGPKTLETIRPYICVGGSEGNRNQ
jgi:comEA protein